MKKAFLVFVILVILIQFASAANISIDYQIFDNKVLAEFNFPEGGHFNGQIPRDVKSIETGLDYNLDYNNNLKISSSNPFKFSYISETIIDESISKNFFIIKNPVSQKSKIQVFLPEGAFLAEENRLIFPKEYKLSTDGTRIIIQFTDFDEEEILISYIPPKKLNLFYYIIILLIVFVIAIYLAMKNRKRKKKKESSIEHLLNEREKQILNILQERSPVKQSRLSKLTEIPKASLSRHLQQLEKKKLIIRSGEGKNKLVSLK